MEAIYSQQLSTLPIYLITGVFLGAFYDLVRIIRCIFGVEYYSKNKYFKLKNLKSKKNSKISSIKENIVMLITDILFFLFSGIIIAIIVYYANSGIVRWYIFVCCILGFLAYYFTLGKLVIRIANTVGIIIRSIFSQIVYLFIYPLKPIVLLTMRLFVSIKLKINSREDKKTEDIREILLSYGK